MNAFTQHGTWYPVGNGARHDGWTDERQRLFLEAIAAGATVEAACTHVGMSASSAYALRRRAAGAAFSLGWSAANLLARDRIADALTTRALDGQVETYTRPDGGTYTRHRYDNRLASTMLARLDRQVDDAAATPSHDAARLIAGAWDGWLHHMAEDSSPAAAALFLQRRGLGGGKDERDLAPLLALAGADRWLRAGADIAREVDTSDLDPRARSGWTAEQWARAEAAGIVRLAEPAKAVEAARDRELPPLQEGDDRIWWDEEWNEYQTSFPPPADFRGIEFGAWGEEDYARHLTPEELALVEASDEANAPPEERPETVEDAACARDAVFAALAAKLAASRDGTTAPAGVLNGHSTLIERQYDGRQAQAEEETG